MVNNTTSAVESSCPAIKPKGEFNGERFEGRPTYTPTDHSPNRAPFAPYGLFTGSWMPEWLERRGELGPATKMVYARLTRYAGKKSTCKPGIKKLAAALAMSEKSIRIHLNKLVEVRLIYKTQRGVRQSNTYGFLKHPWMDKVPLKGAKKKRENQDVTPQPERLDSTGPERLKGTIPERLNSTTPVLRQENRRYKNLRKENSPPITEKVQPSPPPCVGTATAAPEHSAGSSGIRKCACGGLLSYAPTHHIETCCMCRREYHREPGAHLGIVKGGSRVNAG